MDYEGKGRAKAGQMQFKAGWVKVEQGRARQGDERQYHLIHLA
jgi:hypothetical protein